MNEEYEDQSEEIETEAEYNEDDITAKISAAISPEAEEEVPQPEPVKEELPEPSIPDDYKVKVGDNEVSLSELKNGYLRQSDYTKKTTELSQERQAVEAQKAEYVQFVNSIPLLADVAVNNVNEAQARLYDPAFIELASTDPASYIAEKAKLESVIIQNTQSYNEMKKQYELHQQENFENQQHAIHDAAVKAHEQLSKEIPGWADGHVLDALGEYAPKVGLRADEMAALVDPRLVHILHKAMQYDELMAKQSVATKKVQNVPTRAISPSNDTKAHSDDSFAARKAAALRSGDESRITALLSELL